MLEWLGSADVPLSDAVDVFVVAPVVSAPGVACGDVDGSVPAAGVGTVAGGDVGVSPPVLAADGPGAGGGAGAGGFAPITDSIRAQVDVVVAELSICALCCAVTALCMAMPMVSAITLFNIAIDCESALPLSSCCTSVTEERI
ncbi:hypothetical protein GCM10011413_31580 [Pedobacter psychrotolerans]|uniref:Uncharacterized protein n=1 Tax=Pedobacter psychrotolerans TaxID=1843235 RepID=A0ABQ1SUU5_9SPHI|nr:hypothetical protein GCM10011413_31580 [Pedobacter psychrotolerans]